MNTKITMGNKAYSAYKDSGVEWLGEIPEHWEINRLKSTIDFCQNGIWGEEPNGINDLPCVRVADFNRIRNRINFPIPTLRSISMTERQNRLLLKNNLLIEKSGGGDLQPVGVVVLYDSNEPAVCSNFVARMHIKPGYDPNYLCYLHTSLYSLRINTKSIKQNTGIQNLDTQAYFDEKVGFPPLPEQRAIAAFLDRETARIDALIDRYQRLMGLLEEKRSSLISQAVTKGLDASVEMKDSGVEWLGQVPSHWDVKRLKWTIEYCQNGIWGDEPNGINDIPCVRVADFDRARNRVNFPVPTFRSISKLEIQKRLLLENDLLIEKSGGGDSQPVGVVVLYDSKETTICSNFVARMPVKSGFDPNYLCYLHAGLYSLKINTKSIKQNTGIQNLDTQAYFDEKVGFPPIIEQHAIANYLDNENLRIGFLKDKMKKTITKLQEYRTAIISAAVTGKVDVRG